MEYRENENRFKTGLVSSTHPPQFIAELRSLDSGNLYFLQYADQPTIARGELYWLFLGLIMRPNRHSLALTQLVCKGFYHSA